MVVKKKSKSKPKGKARPPRVFIKKGKMYIQVGKKKVLIRDAKKFSKADIINILLNQLLIRRKRRARGKMTRREKKLNREDLKIFQEFENLNRSKSNTLKIPAIPDKKGLNTRDVLFYNAILAFMKMLPKKDINIQVQEDIKKQKASSTSRAVVPYVERVENNPLPKFTDAQYEKLKNEYSLTKKQLEATRQTTFFSLDLLNFEKRVKNKTSKKKGMLKKWKEDVENKYGVKINANSKTSFTDYVVRIVKAYPDTLDSREFYEDYSKIRDKMFDVVKPPTVPLDVSVEEEKEEKEGKQEPRRSQRIRDIEEQKDVLESEDEDEEKKTFGHASQFTDPDANPDDTNPEIALAATAVLDQVASGNYYTGKGLTTDEIDTMMKPLLGDMYLGTLPLDFSKFLPKKLPNDKMAFIMNTDPSNKEGKHWVSVIIDLSDDLSIEYFDSFGREPPKKFMKEIKKLIDRLKPHSYLKFKTNRVQLQDKNTQNCGFFSMKFLIDRLLNDLSFKEATGFKNEIIDNSIEGENNIKQLKNKFGYI